MSTYAVTNPNTGQVEETFDSLTPDQIPGILDTAHQGFLTWRDTPITERAAILTAAADIFESRTEELAAVIGREMGKPQKQAETEVAKVAATARWYAKNGPDHLEPTPLPDAEGADETYVRHDPLGVLLGIMPWNFPYNQIARFTLPNLIVGNAVLMKQAAICPRSSQLFQEILEEAGLPRGVYTNLYLNTEDTELIIQDFRVKGISLTGSEKAGASVAGLAAKHLKRSVLELGGNDPAVVLDTDDVGELAQKLVKLRTTNAGQVCTSPKRLIVLDEIYDEFVQTAKSAVDAVKVGPADDPDTDMGPLASEGARDEVVQRIQQAAKDGATVHTGGEKLDRDGWFMSPALITDIDPDSDLGCNELFGPAVMVYRAKDEDQALKLANGTQYGLMASVWTTDSEKGRAFAEKINAGMTFVNTHMDSSPQFPFGGINNSGYGRENAQWALREFTNERLVRLNTSHNS